MTKKRTRGEIAIEVSEIAGAARRATSPVPRALDDMEELAYPGAREIATLTVAARSLDWQFEPVMRALQAASKITDWSHPFMVAQRIKGDSFGPSFNWRDAPYCYYKSFEDFYSIELEATFGTWENLQHTWSEVVKGKITEDEARKLILRDKAGRPPKSDKENSSNTTIIGRGAAYTLARLDRDGLGELAGKVRAGEISANAAAIAAGFRKQKPFAQIKRLILKLLPKLSDDERAELQRLLD